MTRKMIMFIVLGVFLLTTACVQQGNIPPMQNADPEDGDSGKAEIEQLHEGIGPLEITPDPSRTSLETPMISGQEGGNISSSGKRSSAGEPGNSPGQIGSVGPEGMTPEEAQDQPQTWLTYLDEEFNFSINYPDSYTILPEPEPFESIDPGLLQRVRFLDAQLAAGNTAEYEPPNFTIEVFAQDDMTLEEFVSRDEKRGDREAYVLGNMVGIRVILMQLIAPNQFYYFAQDGYIYKLTPLGPYAVDMLSSFQVK